MRCHYRIYNTRNIQETIDSFARGPYVSSFEPICVRSTFRGVHTLIFTYVPYIVIGLHHEEPANFYREKQSVAFVTGYLLTFLVVLFLICLVTTQILICDIIYLYRT